METHYSTAQIYRFDDSSALPKGLRGAWSVIGTGNI